MHKYIFVLVLPLLLTGCGTFNLFGGSKEPLATTTPAASFAGSTPTEFCPAIDVRDGAAVHKISNGKSDGPLDVRFQASLEELARECTIENGTHMRMKIGIEGKVIVGPMGGNGSINLPIRAALVKNQDAPIWNKFYSVNVLIPANTPHVTFSQIENDISFPLPPLSELSQYTLWVGFDPKGELAKPARSQKRK